MSSMVVVGLGVVVLGGVAYLLRDKLGALRARAGQAAGAAAPAGAAEAEAKGPKVNWLIGKTGEHRGKSYHIGYRTVTIGREPTNLIQVVEEKVSRKHCQITPRDGFLQVVDMSSANGTFINGTPITQGRLNPADELRVGSAAFIYCRSANFEADGALERKRVGRETNKETFAAEGEGLALLVRAALDNSQGDVTAAARSLGVPPAMVLAIMEAKGIEPGKD